MGSFTDKIKFSNPNPGECNWDEDWYRNQFLNELLHTQGLNGNYVDTGGVLSYISGLVINVSAGTVNINGTFYTFASDSLSVVSASAGEEVRNWIYINSSGALVSAISPPTGNFTLLGLVDSDTTSVVRFSDLRKLRPVYAVKQKTKNDIINGTFDIWQRATSQTTSGTGSDDVFSNNHVGSTKTHSRQAFTVGQTVVPGNPTYYSRTVVTSVAGTSNYCLKLQKVIDVERYAGKRVAFEFYAAADTTKDIAIEGIQFFGSGGSSSVNGISSQKVSLTTSWTKYVVFIDFPSITGKTIGTDSSNIFQIWFDAGSNFDARTDTLGQQSGTFDLSEIKSYISDEELPTERPNKNKTLEDCRFYYRIIPHIDLYLVHSSSGVKLGMYHYKMAKTPSVTIGTQFEGTIGVSLVGDNYLRLSTTNGTSNAITRVTGTILDAGI